MKTLKMNLLNKMIIIISILFLLSISLATINAAETNITSSDNLGQTIENSSDGDTINLDTGTYNNNVTNITINKNLTISGKNPETTIIDAEKLGGIFYITGNNTVTLINLTFINGIHNNGGAILAETGVLNIINCRFYNNTAPNAGGAIAITTANLTVMNSTFIDNNATYGGAILVEFGEVNQSNTLNITNCNFINNNGTYGGALFNFGNMTVDNCIFSNNNATYGGAIFNALTIVINNSNFINNSLSAISNTNEFEGQIFPNVTNASVFNSNFTNNVLTIYSNENITIQGCNIINNTQGIFLTSSTANITINYNRIFNNTNATGFNLDNNAATTNADLNWWGDNTPLVSGITLGNYFIMNVTNLTSTVTTGVARFNYTFGLNTNDAFDSNLLPYFVTNVYTNITTVIQETFDARFNRTVELVTDKGGQT